MNVVAFDKDAEPESKPHEQSCRRAGFWSALAQMLDSLAVYPTRHALSEQELRRVTDDIERCRTLMFKNPQHYSHASRGRGPTTVRRDH